MTTTHGGDGDAAMIMTVDVFLVVTYFPLHQSKDGEMLMYKVDRTPLIIGLARARPVSLVRRKLAPWVSMPCGVCAFPLAAG